MDTSPPSTVNQAFRPPSGTSGSPLLVARTPSCDVGVVGEARTSGDCFNSTDSAVSMSGLLKSAESKCAKGMPRDVEG